MKFLKAITTDDQMEYFALDKILTVTPQGDNVKILMGAGLYWRVKKESMEIVDLSDNTFKYEIKEEKR